MADCGQWRFSKWRGGPHAGHAVSGLLRGRSPRAFLADGKGVSAVEFALIAPVMLLMGLGLIVFGFTLNNQTIIVHAAAAGIQQFSESRSLATPYTATTTTINSAATGLTPFGLTSPTLTITLSVAGTACASDTACATALSANAAKTATVTVSYPCNLQVMGFTYGGGASCKLSSSAAGMIQ